MVFINNKNIVLFFLSIFFITVEIKAMFPIGAKHPVTSEQRQKALNAIRILQESKVEPFSTDIPKCSDNELLIYSDNNPLSQGTCWPQNILLLSNTFKEYIEDLG